MGINRLFIPPAGTDELGPIDVFVSGVMKRNCRRTYPVFMGARGAMSKYVAAKKQSVRKYWMIPSRSIRISVQQMIGAGQFQFLTFSTAQNSTPNVNFRSKSIPQFGAPFCTLSVNSTASIPDARFSLAVFLKTGSAYPNRAPRALKKLPLVKFLSSISARFGEALIQLLKTDSLVELTCILHLFDDLHKITVIMCSAIRQRFLVEFVLHSSNSQRWPRFPRLARP
jgi:hypothetical protein